ncbi:MAG TPA: alpha/beta hydrolase [Nakamurella sp.]
MTDEGYRLVVPPRRAFGVGAAGRGEYYVTDAEDVARLLGDGAHLVEHSYGALVAISDLWPIDQNEGTCPVTLSTNQYGGCESASHRQLVCFARRRHRRRVCE